MTTTTFDRPRTRTRSAPSGRVEGYVRRLAQFHATARYPDLPDAVSGEALVRLGGYGDGLLTVSVRESQLSEEHLRGLFGFRLSQFLQIGLMDPELVHRRRLIHEPLPTKPVAGPETVHTVTMTEEGKIVGYIALVASEDPEPLPLDEPGRWRFPVEVAHDVELLSAYAGPETTSHNVYEIKRFVRERSMPRGPQRARVPWHLILAIGKVALSTGLIQVVVGDSGERGALRHLHMVGFDVHVVEGTNPWLPRSELMWPSYELPREQLAKPFSGRVPEGLGDVIGAIESRLAEAP